jgi:methylthioribose-1-phosphate isomerase
MGDYFAVRWDEGVVVMLDQRQLPEKVEYILSRRADEVADAIKNMIIRGAPAIGIAAGYGLALCMYHSRARNAAELINEVRNSAELLKKSRPTAVNLFWAIDRILKVIESLEIAEVERIKLLGIAEALKIHEEDIKMNKKIGTFGQQLIANNANLIHHCNTGALATGGYGTALGVIRAAYEFGKNIHVFVDETRPRLQGSRLTSWELKQLGIAHTIIVDGASGIVMKKNKIDACLVGCDRIASNGDVANKIGTYNLAIVAKAHGVPFYSAGPTSTIDMTIASGEEIPIEDRSADEITHIGDVQLTPGNVDVYNPAFDVTPAEYITAIITNEGVVNPPYRAGLEDVLKSRR